MPRKHRAARDRPRYEPPKRSAAAEAADRLRRPGWEVASTTKSEGYRCPGCQQMIAPGTPHVVAWPSHDQQQRRHWHTPCWERELRRSR